ncbi:hypothetical protein [Candidatus Nitrosotenuis uzonensis]|uniref:Uncharacterized protein n=1 Tax=Candidatus Nitrosotenuis uzonensis TaxID=1407055 RepID=A0A812EYM1_9ARCH|nr:hypothetical protein [Candidatus Nitrosotenuis uzonensis]MCA2003176.1 hypothetical protein [Candidatus Nitrosotenuis sp.]CAE6493621.1 conserved hypothetical protein [Candidatus Nitrosotenuis uzonensis]
MYSFIAIMWALILAGGGILVVLVSQISISGYGEQMDFLIASVIKAVIAIVLVVLWIIVLTKLKNKIFQKQIRS